MDSLRNISWVSVFAALWLAAAFLFAAVGAAQKNWYVIATAAVWAVAGVGMVLLSMREDR